MLSNFAKRGITLNKNIPILVSSAQYVDRSQVSASSLSPVDIIATAATKAIENTKCNNVSQLAATIDRLMIIRLFQHSLGEGME